MVGSAIKRTLLNRGYGKINNSSISAIVDEQSKKNKENQNAI